MTVCAPNADTHVLCTTCFEYREQGAPCDCGALDNIDFDDDDPSAEWTFVRDLAL